MIAPLNSRFVILRSVFDITVLASGFTQTSSALSKMEKNQLGEDFSEKKSDSPRKASYIGCSETIYPDQEAIIPQK
jgi:hypothetical protein